MLKGRPRDLQPRKSWLAGNKPGCAVVVTAAGRYVLHRSVDLKELGRCVALRERERKERDGGG
jgi:hypothetical protein